jgi:hypothetical protein
VIRRALRDEDGDGGRQRPNGVFGEQRAPGLDPGQIVDEKKAPLQGCPGAPSRLKIDRGFKTDMR